MANLKHIWHLKMLGEHLKMIGKLSSVFHYTEVIPEDDTGA
jgi:hypothetical protein